MAKYAIDSADALQTDLRAPMFELAYRTVFDELFNKIEKYKPSQCDGRTVKSLSAKDKLYQKSEMWHYDNYVLVDCEAAGTPYRRWLETQVYEYFQLQCTSMVADCQRIRGTR